MKLDSCINVNELGRFLNLSTQIFVDETKNDNHIKIRHKLEFFEAFARLVDECSFSCVNESYTFPQEPFNDLDLGDKLWCVSTNIIGKVIDPANKTEIRLLDLY